MTSIFLNEDEYYKDGYKVIVTKEDNKMIPFTVDKISPNHIGIQLDSIDDLSDDELIKVDLTPAIMGGSATGYHEEKGFKFTWTAKDTGETPICGFTFPFPDKTGIPFSMHGEIRTNDGHKWRFDYNEGVTGDCFWMSGGTFRLLQYKHVVVEDILFEVPIPFVNGADFDLKVTPSATDIAESTAVESLVSMIQ